MIIGLLCLGGALYLMATKRRPMQSRIMSSYWCEIHQDYFILPGNAQYAACPSCFTKFEAMENDVLS